MLFIIGKSGTGKDTLAQYLEERLGMKGVLSYTNRPKRANEAGTHRFFQGDVCFGRQPDGLAYACIAPGPDVSQIIPDVIAFTRIGEFCYFATLLDFRQADYYIIDPDGFYELVQAGLVSRQDTVVYLQAPSASVEKHVVNRELTTAQSLAAYRLRSRNEAARFEQFERLLEDWDFPCEIFCCQNHFRSFEDDPEFAPLLRLLHQQCKGENHE